MTKDPKKLRQLQDDVAAINDDIRSLYQWRHQHDKQCSRINLLAVGFAFAAVAISGRR